MSANNVLSCIILYITVKNLLISTKRIAEWVKGVILHTKDPSSIPVKGNFFL